MPAPKSSSDPKTRRSASSSAKKPAAKRTTKPKPAKATASSTPLDLVILTRARIQETLDEAAERGRVTRSDANELVQELVRRGRQQTDGLMAEVERRVAAATRVARRVEPVDRLVRTADRARRTVGVGSSFPISGYDDLTAAQVTARLDPLKPAELRRVRDYERRHANRKSVLDAIEKALG
jgi:polyhydroxyalkanoate synthesis regulator phasin